MPTAVIAVRYPELDNVQNDLICFGNYLLGEQATDIGAAVDWQVTLSSDENGCLAVLHNRNKMVATFGNSEWVTQSEGFLLRVRATRLRASASLESAKKPDILMERKREAVPPMPMALTVLESSVIGLDQ